MPMNTRNIPQPGHYSFATQPLDRSDINVVPTPSERTGRKSYKLSNRKSGEKKEAVWPPLLEDALLDGLRKYRPVSKSGRPLRRFTKRNVSISRHIFAITGQIRTAKQVGSRLQQITESTKDAEITRLITCRELDRDLHCSSEPLATYSQADSVVPDLSYSSPTIITTPSSSVSTSDVGSPEDTAALDDSVSLFAELVPVEGERAAYLGLDADINNQGINLILTVNHADSAQASSGSFYNARRLSSIPSSVLLDSVPTLSIVSSFLSPGTRYACSFTVYLDGVSSVHTEDTPLSVVKPEYPAGLYTYVSPLLPVHWERLVHRASIDRYTIMVDIVELRANASLDVVRKLSVAITMKLDNSEEMMQPSCSESPYYMHNPYDDALNMQSEFPDMPLANLSASSSALPDLPYPQISPAFPIASNIPPWNDGSYFNAPSAYIPCTGMIDSRFLSNQDVVELPSYSFHSLNANTNSQPFFD